jgi:hypothetical protein
VERRVARGAASVVVRGGRVGLRPGRAGQGGAGDGERDDRRQGPRAATDASRSSVTVNSIEIRLPSARSAGTASFRPG